MSLRRRLSLWTTLILALVFAVFSTLAYFTVSALLYSPIDENLKSQTIANVVYLSRLHQIVPQLGSIEQFGSVFFSVIDPNGRPLSVNQNIPISEPLLQRALSGEEAWGYISLPNGGPRARVYIRPVYANNRTTGQNELYVVLQAATPLDLPDRIMSSLSAFLAVASAVLLVVGAIGSNVVAGRALRVVNNVTRQARQIETSRDLSQRIPEPGTEDEIGNLVRTFNQMLASLDAAFAAQRRFVADSSHELRTPLTVIKGNLHLLRRAVDGRERAELIATTEAEISRLNRMVNDLLYIAQIQAGHDVKLVMRPVEMDSLLLDVFALARSIAALKEQKVVLVHEDIATTLGDRDQLQHLLLNLVDNALKYSPPGGTITIGMWVEDGWARLEVGDNGPGIAAADLPMLFERFFRTQEARQVERSGSGLGLAIVKSIVDAHRGRVEVFSEPEQGTTFRVWLPLAPAAYGVVAPEAPDADMVDEDEPAPSSPAQVSI